MSEKKHVLNFSEQAVIDSLYRFQEGLYPKDGELHDEHGNVIESGFLLRESIRPVPKMLLCASLWPKTSADKKTSVGLQGMEAALSVLQEHGLVREVTRPRMVYGAWKRVDGLIFESLETARAGEAKYRIRRANGEPILEADPFTIEGATWTRGYELTSAGIDHVRNTQAAPTTAHATKNGEVTITDAMSLKDTPPRSRTLPELQEYDRQAYQLYYFVFGNQQRVADELTKQHHRPFTQGQVSRMIARVKKQAAASGLTLPEPAKREKAMDPAKLELGQRTDHRTPHQRPRPK